MLVLYSLISSVKLRRGFSCTTQHVLGFILSSRIQGCVQSRLVLTSKRNFKLRAPRARALFSTRTREAQRARFKPTKPSERQTKTPTEQAAQELRLQLRGAPLIKDGPVRESSRLLQQRSPIRHIPGGRRRRSGIFPVSTRL